MSTDAQLEQRHAVRRLVRITRHHVGDATPTGVDQGATISQRGLATVAVAHGPLTPQQFRQGLRGACQHGHLLRFTWDGRARYTVPWPRLLHRIQREGGERGDRETVAKAQRHLAQVTDR